MRSCAEELVLLGNKEKVFSWVLSGAALVKRKEYVYVTVDSTTNNLG